MKRNQNNALANETTASNVVDITTAKVETPAVAKPKQFIVGTSEKGKQFIDDLCKELQVKGKTGKLIALPSHAAVDMLIAIATDYRFRQVEVSPAIEASEGVEAVEAVVETFDRFEEYALKFEDERNNSDETEEALLSQLEKIKAKLAAKINKMNL